MSPFGWSPDISLGVVVGLAVGGAAVSMLALWLLRRPWRSSAEAPDALHPYEIAYLSRRRRGLTHAVFLAQKLGGHVSMGPLHAADGEDGSPYRAPSSTKPEIEGLEQAVFDSKAQTREAARKLEGALVHQGMLLSAPRRWLVRSIGPLMLLPAVLYGVLRFPELAFLLAFMLYGTLFLAIGVVAANNRWRLYCFFHLTGRGASMMEQLKRRNAGLERTLYTAPHQLSVTDVVLCAALFFRDDMLEITGLLPSEPGPEDDSGQQAEATAFGGQSRAELGGRAAMGGVAGMPKFGPRSGGNAVG